MILKELSEAIGVSGDESAVRQVILQHIDSHAQDIRIDALGSITALKKAVKPGRRARPRVMLAAHMDEVGFMVTGIDGDGSLRFTNIGGIDDRILPALRVRVGAEGIPGVILWTPIHKNRDQATRNISSLRIDIGATSKDEAGGKVKPGDRVVFDSRYLELGAETLRGKAFDDRVGCSLLVDVLQAGPYPCDVLAAFTVQEEIGLRGAKVAAQHLKPEVALALEGTTANDILRPTADPDDPTLPNPTCTLGAGPVLTVMDASLIVNPRLLGFLRAVADSHGIPYQLKTTPGGGTDAGAIHRTGAGVPSAVISVPCRYIHSPAALLRRADYDHTLKLIQAVLYDLTMDALDQDS
jgi:endoglucanase